MVKKRGIKNDFFVVTVLRNWKDGIVINWAREGCEQSRIRGKNGVWFRKCNRYQGGSEYTSLKFRREVRGGVINRDYWYMGNI